MSMNVSSLFIFLLLQYQKKKLTSREYGLTYKLSETLLSALRQQRQRVKYAAQLLSKTDSSAITYLGEDGCWSRHWKETADKWIKGML